MNTIAELRALSTDIISDGVNLYVSGYNSGVDGGGGVFKYNAASAVMDDAATVIAPDSGVGRYLRMIAGPVTPQMMGALGNGVDDDTTAFTKALAQGIPVIVPPPATSYLFADDIFAVADDAEAYIMGNRGAPVAFSMFSSGQNLDRDKLATHYISGTLDGQATADRIRVLQALRLTTEGEGTNIGGEGPGGFRAGNWTQALGVFKEDYAGSPEGGEIGACYMTVRNGGDTTCDTGCILGDVGGYTDAFLYFTESVTRHYTSGVEDRTIRNQIGVVHHEANLAMGFYANIEKGTGTHGLLLSTTTGASWTAYVTGLNSSGGVNAQIQGSGLILGIHDFYARYGTDSQVRMGDVGGFAGLVFGDDLDTNLYRLSADHLQTNDSLTVLGLISATGTGTHSVGKTNIGSDGSTYANLAIGAQLTGSRYAYIDLVADATYTTYANRIIRNNTGADATTDFLHRGTGFLNFKAEDAAGIRFLTNGANTRLTISSTGVTIAEGIIQAKAGVYDVNSVQVLGTRGAAVADASGGATIDAEARTALNALLARLRTHGIIASA